MPERIRTILSSYAGIRRDGAGLNAAANELDALGTGPLTTVARAVVAMATTRQESAAATGVPTANFSPQPHPDRRVAKDAASGLPYRSSHCFPATGQSGQMDCEATGAEEVGRRQLPPWSFEDTGKVAASTIMSRMWRMIDSADSRRSEPVTPIHRVSRKTTPGSSSQSLRCALPTTRRFT
jgi:hypothetical protein